MGIQWFSCFVKELILVYYQWLQRQKARITNCEKVLKETYKDFKKQIVLHS